MAIAKRVVLFLLVNFLVITVGSFILYAFDIQPYLTPYGLNYASLAIFCLIWGMAGAFISLGLSRVMAKWMMGVQIIDPNTSSAQLRDLVQTVHHLCKKAGLSVMPQVGIYQSNEVNAFATGPTRKRSLVAVSSGLLNRLGSQEVEAVLGHEVTHIANGDMVTMTLLQGIINAFVMFFARILAFSIARALGRRDDDSTSVSPLFYQLTVFVLQIVFMALGSIVVAAYSRRREFRADLGGARLASPQKMINALIALQNTDAIQDPELNHKAVQAMKISNPNSFLSLFSSHPPIDQRIARLKERFKMV